MPKREFSMFLASGSDCTQLHTISITKELRILRPQFQFTEVMTIALRAMLAKNKLKHVFLNSGS